MSHVVCTNCGQCVNRCPTGALVEKTYIDHVWDAIYDKDKHVVVQTAPAVRAALVQGKVMFFDSDDGFYVPVELATGVEREQVLSLALKQLTVTADMLPLVPAEEGSPPPDVAAES